MDIDKIELNRTIQMLMRHMHDSQTSIGRVIGLSQPQIGFRLRAPDDPKQIDWGFLELTAIAKHWGIPLTTLCSGRAAAMQWVTDNIIDLTGQPVRPSTWRYPYRSDDPRLFDPDEPPEVIDLTDRIVAQMHQKEPADLYAATG